MIPQEYIQEVVRRNDIEDIVGQYVQLRRRGRTLTGLCPFHNEKTPSFVVYPDTQSFYCFGCGAAGDVISFVRKYNNLGYVETVKQLASRAGMPLPEEDDKESRARQRLLEINRCAARYFYEQLNARTPEAAADFAKSARANGYGVILCAAGMAAHLAGAFAANTTLPVVGIPMKGGALDGLDALLATVQMPSGFPVATVALNGAKNAAYLAVAILAVADDDLAAKLDKFRADTAAAIAKKDAAIAAEAAAL